MVAIDLGSFIVKRISWLGELAALAFIIGGISLAVWLTSGILGMFHNDQLGSIAYRFGSDSTYRSSMIRDMGGDFWLLVGMFAGTVAACVVGWILIRRAIRRRGAA